MDCGKREPRFQAGFLAASTLPMAFDSSAASKGLGTKPSMPSLGNACREEKSGKPQKMGLSRISNTHSCQLRERSCAHDAVREGKSSQQVGQGRRCPRSYTAVGMNRPHSLPSVRLTGTRHRWMACLRLSPTIHGHQDAGSGPSNSSDQRQTPFSLGSLEDHFGANQQESQLFIAHLPMRIPANRE
jgi:hypothetical protein